MASYGRRLCEICYNSNVTTDATEWCPECNKDFCKKCKAHHDVANATKKHKTILIENVMKLPESVQDITYTCDDHYERYVCFCREHERPCCTKCMKDDFHNGCLNFINVETAVENVKQSPPFLDLQTTLSDLLSNISNIHDDQTASLFELARQKVACEDEIRLSRKAINMFFDELEKEFNYKMQKIFTKIENEKETLLIQLDMCGERVNELHENINLIRDGATDFQTFMAIPEYVKFAYDAETTLRSICGNEFFNWNSITVITTNMQSVIDNLPSFGTLSIKRKASNVNLKVRRTRQSHYTGTSMFSKKIETIRFENRFRHQIPAAKNTHEILDCGILPNGNLLFSDRSNKCLFKFDTNSEFVQMELPFNPVQFAIVDDNNIVATSGSQMHLVNLETDAKILLSYSFERQSRLGSVIIYDKNYIIEVLTGFIMTDSDTRLLKDIRIEFDDIAYRVPVCIDKKLYFVDNKTNMVLCYDFEGNKIWEFKNENLMSAYGLSSNGFNILFVCGQKSDNVCALSADGKTFKEIIGPSMELKGATAVYYCVKRKTLLVVNNNGNTFVFFNNESLC